MTANEIALTAVKALDSKKGQDIKCLETGHLTTLADYFVLCTATSTTQIKALADVCEKTLKDAGEPPHHVEGHRGGTWILLDFSSLWCTSSTRRPGSFTTWSACGATPRRWICPAC